MPEIPTEAVEALVPLQEAIRRVLIDARLGDGVDELSARVAVAVAVELGGPAEAAGPILAAQVRRQAAEQIAEALELRANGAAHEARRMAAYGAPLQAEMASSNAGVFADGAAIARQIGEGRG